MTRDRAEYMRQILADPLPELLEQRAPGEKSCQWSEFDRVITAFVDGRLDRDGILRATTAYRRGRALPANLLKVVRSAG